MLLTVSAAERHVDHSFGGGEAISIPERHTLSLPTSRQAKSVYQFPSTNYSTFFPICDRDVYIFHMFKQ